MSRPSHFRPPNRPVLDQDFVRRTTLWLIFSATAIANAQDSPRGNRGDVAGIEGRRIEAVELRGADGLDGDRIIGLLGVRPGGVFAHAQLTAGIRHLLRRPEIASVHLSGVATDDDGRIRLEITLNVLPRLDEIYFIGNEVVSSATLMDSLVLSPGDVLREIDLLDTRKRLLAQYHDDGFLFANVELELNPLPEAPTSSVLLVRIVEGGRVTISHIEIEGNEAFSDSQLRAVMKNRPRILFGLISKGYYRSEIFEEDLERLRTLYHGRGHLDVVVQRGDLVVAKNSREIRLTVAIDEGPRFRIGRILIKGHNEALEQPLRQRIRVKSGDYYDAAEIASDLRRLLDYYQGRLLRSPWIDVEPLYDLEREQEVDLVFDVDERRHYFAGRVAITGNTQTRHHVLRDQLEVEPLGPITQPLIDESAEGLRSLNYFKTAEVTTAPSAEADIVKTEGSGDVHVDDVKDVTVEVEDTSEGMFFVSGGAESGKGEIAAIGISKPNFDLFDWPGGERGWKRPFTGGGQFLRIEVIPGTRNSQFNLFFREPHFFNSHHALSLSANSDIFHWRDFDEIHLGSDLGVRTYWDRERHLSSRMSWVIEDVNLDDLDSDTDPFFRTFRGHTFFSYPSIRLTYKDAKINRFSGPRGLRAESRFDLALDETGSETEFVRSLTSLDYSIDVNPWLNRLFRDDPFSVDIPSMAQILHFGGRFGWMEGVSGDDVPFFEKFFLGGPRSFRGFDYRGVGPRINDIPIGEETYWRGTVDYSFPLFIPEIRVQGIFEFGDIQPRVSDYSSDSLRTSAGAGLLVRLEILEQVVPVNLYWVEALNKERFDDDRLFTFTLGFDF